MKTHILLDLLESENSLEALVGQCIRLYVDKTVYYYPITVFFPEEKELEFPFNLKYCEWGPASLPDGEHCIWLTIKKSSEVKEDCIKLAGKDYWAIFDGYANIVEDKDSNIAKQLQQIQKDNYGII